MSFLEDLNGLRAQYCFDCRGERVRWVMNIGSPGLWRRWWDKGARIPRGRLVGPLFRDAAGHDVCYIGYTNMSLLFMAADDLFLSVNCDWDWYLLFRSADELFRFYLGFVAMNGPMPDGSYGDFEAVEDKYEKELGRLGDMYG
ncbi:MAG: hypothetical protein U0795_22400 [Pirellulales bacterium]